MARPRVWRPVSPRRTWSSSPRKSAGDFSSSAAAIPSRARCWKSPSREVPCRRVPRRRRLAHRSAAVSSLEERRIGGRDVRHASIWRDDFVSFLIGCSFTFEAALLQAGSGCGTSNWASTSRCIARTGPASGGRFRRAAGGLDAAALPADAIRAVQITSRYPDVHGAPVHIGLPEQIGIADLPRARLRRRGAVSETTSCLSSGPAASLRRRCCGRPTAAGDHAQSGLHVRDRCATTNRSRRNDTLSICGGRSTGPRLPRIGERGR